MQILSAADPDAVNLAISALKDGKLVIYPTETCYGIAVDAGNPDAVSRLLAYKGDRYRQISIAVSDHEMALQYVDLNSLADNLYTHFLPGPITVISQSKHSVDERLESVAGTIGIRIPNHKFALELITKFGKPITATSANTSGKKEPYSLADWQKYTTLGKQELVSIFLDGGKLADRPTSTVVDTTLNDPTILRQGELIIPSIDSQTFQSSSPEATQLIAGEILKKHLNLIHSFPLIIALQGELGTGKTQFSKGVAAALGITANVSSPTYTLLKEYEFSHSKYTGILYHIDTWRLPDPAEIESTLHLSNLLQPGNIIIMEWAGKAKNLLHSYENKYPIILVDIQELDVNIRQIRYAFSTPEWS